MTRALEASNEVGETCTWIREQAVQLAADTDRPWDARDDCHACGGVCVCLCIVVERFVVVKFNDQTFLDRQQKTIESLLKNGMDPLEVQKVTGLAMKVVAKAKAELDEKRRKQGSDK
jgi:hypothetical protein